MTTSCAELGLIPVRRMGQLLRDARERAGLTMSELASKTGGRFDRRAIDAVERGRRPCSDDEIAVLTEGLGNQNVGSSVGDDGGDVDAGVEGAGQ